MKKRAGVWIDRRKAVVVTVAGGGEETKQIQSNLEKRVRNPSEHARSTDDGPEDQSDRVFARQLGRYYDKVIARIGAAESVLIFGPGQAKAELRKRLETKSPRGRTIVLETIAKMTDRQIAAKVRRHFLR